MGLFKRVNDIVTANLNELVDGFEDPEKMLRQAIREMEAALRSALDGAAKVIANEKLLTRQIDEHRRQAAAWRQRAETAVGADDDATARRALRRKAEHETLRAAMEDQLAAANIASGKLRRQIEAMRVRLAEARRKLLTLTARHRAAEARKRFVSDLGGVSIHDEAFGRFDRLSERIEQAEAEAEALVELAGGEADDEASEPEIEVELQALKEKCASGERGA